LTHLDPVYRSEEKFPVTTQNEATQSGTAERRRLSWKEIAAHLGVSVRTAQRWETAEGLPVRRHRHAKLSTSYAYTDELNAWWNGRPDGSRRRRSDSRDMPEGQAASIAVLPFACLDRDVETEILSEGLTSELITALSQVDGLRVVARTSTLAFKDAALDVREVGVRLGVETVLEGSVRREGNRLRVAAQLIRAGDGCHLWARRFDRELRHRLDVQDELATAITRSLRVRLERQEPRAHRRAADPETYNLFVRGRYFWNQRTREGIEKALECYREAVEKDPDFALAHAGLAECYVFRWIYGGYPWDDAVENAEAAAARALDLDPASNEAHTSLGVARVAQLDLRSARDEFRQALELRPRDVRARHWCAMAEASLGHIDEAVEEITRAAELDPLGTTVNQDLGRILYLAGRYEEAIVQLRHTLAIAPGAFWGRIYLGLAYVQVGNLGKARSVLAPDPILRAFAEARGGRADEARDVLAREPVVGATPFGPSFISR
jgi:TolB-like protein/Flp pilus assembly protein TadD